MEYVALNYFFVLLCCIATFESGTGDWYLTILVIVVIPAMIPVISIMFAIPLTPLLLLL